MKSKKQMGNYYVAKTIKFLEEEGYKVARLEVNHIVFIGGKTIWVKKDTFGSDLMAINKKHIIFVQVKSSTDGKFDMGTVKREWSQWDEYWPKHSERWLFMWEPRKKPIVKVL